MFTLEGRLAKLATGFVAAVVMAGTTFLPAYAAELPRKSGKCTKIVAEELQDTSFRFGFNTIPEHAAIWFAAAGNGRAKGTPHRPRVFPTARVIAINADEAIADETACPTADDEVITVDKETVGASKEAADDEEAAAGAEEVTDKEKTADDDEQAGEDKQVGEIEQSDESTDGVVRSTYLRLLNSYEQLLGTYEQLLGFFGTVLAG